MKIEQINSTWNHRVMVKQHGDDMYFEIHEVHYDNGIPKAYTDMPVTISGDNIKSLKWTLNRMKECLKKPIIWYGEKFPNEYKGI